MRTAPPSQLPLFRSELQAELLAILLLGTEGPVTTAELRARTGATASSLHRELARLEHAGLVEQDRVGRAKRYRPARDSPLYEPLRELLERTLGVEQLLRERLAALSEVESAAIFG